MLNLGQLALSVMTLIKVTPSTGSQLPGQSQRVSEPSQEVDQDGGRNPAARISSIDVSSVKLSQVHPSTGKTPSLT
jgi:hypothetical protein